MRRAFPIALSAAALALALLLDGCNARPPAQGGTNDCTGCHGGLDSTSGAPPRDLSASSDPHLLTVGAHTAHLAAGVRCEECHRVPTGITDPGHIVRLDGSPDPDRHAEVDFARGRGSLHSAQPAWVPSVDRTTATCSGVYCHGATLGAGGAATTPTWNAGPLPGPACGACHAAPPSTASGHPNVPSTLTGCSLCHPESVNADGSIKPDGKHLDGTVQAAGGHQDFTSPATHGPAFFDSLAGASSLDCRLCHGSDYGGGMGPSCNACHASAGWTNWQTNCSFCHGSKNASTQPGYAIASHPTWSAPPDAIAQRLDPSHAAVPSRTGAHQAHLSGVTAGGQSFALPFTCATCHAVPSDLSHIGGSASRATVALSGAGQASLLSDLGTYTQSTGTCATYCHGTAPTPAWAATGVACGSCHALPPSTASGHPSVSSNLTGCSACHPDTMNGDGTLNVAGGKHLNGIKDASGGHGDYSSPATHGPAFFDALASGGGVASCTNCHGATYDGGIGPSCNACHASAGWTGWQTNCSFCHGSKNASTQAGYAVSSHPTWSAPPDAIAQRLDPAHAAVPARTGAHQAHLTGLTAGGQSFARPFTCATCHAVPANLLHIGGSTSRATVALAGAGQASLPASLGTYSQATGTCTTYCHGTAPTPLWSATGVVCGSCHALPPAPSTGHPTVTGGLTTCSVCHADSVNADGSIKAGGKHLDGVRDSSGMHGDYSSPATHGPRFFDYLAGTGTLDCKACHGATYDGGVGPSCNACHASAGWTGWQTNCSFCHGAKNATTQAGYAVASHPTWSAPPDAISQRLTGVAAPARTGAHQAHLTGVTAGGQSFALPFTCATCHAVPSDLSHIGGSTSRAIVALSGAGQANLLSSLGTYSQATGTCTTYCHGTAPTPLWSATGVVCGSCHALPPAPSTGHPTVTGGLTACSTCHAETMNADGTINVAGGKHLDGLIEATGHGDFSSPATHGPMFFDYLAGTGSLDCKACHGATYDGGIGPSCNACHLGAGWTGSWQTNCSFCHGTRNASTQAGYAVASHPTWSAPPDAIAQRLGGGPDATRTGAHQTHLTGLGSSSGAAYVTVPFPCATCHAVPADYAHAGGPGRAPVVLTGTGSLPANLGTYNQTAGTCTTYCHGSTLGTTATPSWTGGELGCTGCHGYPPSTGEHDLHYYQLGKSCADCHAATVTYPSVSAPYGTIIGMHVNGQANVLFYAPGSTWDGSANCTSQCHGSTDSFPWR